MYLLFISWKSGEHSHYPLPNWAQLQAKLTELGLTPSPLTEGHAVETGYYMERDSTWYSWTEVNPREVFMDLYRHSETLNDYMSADDCVEVFSGICKGESDFTVDLFNEILGDYQSELTVVDARAMDAELNKMGVLFLSIEDNAPFAEIPITDNVEQDILLAVMDELDETDSNAVDMPEDITEQVQKHEPFNFEVVTHDYEDNEWVYTDIKVQFSKP